MDGVAGSSSPDAVVAVYHLYKLLTDLIAYSFPLSLKSHTSLLCTAPIIIST